MQIRNDPGIQFSHCRIYLQTTISICPITLLNMHETMYISSFLSSPPPPPPPPPYSSHLDQRASTFSSIPQIHDEDHFTSLESFARIPEGVERYEYCFLPAHMVQLKPWDIVYTHDTFGNSSTDKRVFLIVSVHDSYYNCLCISKRPPVHEIKKPLTCWRVVEDRNKAFMKSNALAVRLEDNLSHHSVESGLSIDLSRTMSIDSHVEVLKVAHLGEHTTERFVPALAAVQLQALGLQPLPQSTRPVKIHSRGDRRSNSCTPTMQNDLWIDQRRSMSGEGRP